MGQIKVNQPSNPNPVVRIGLLGPYSSRNLGDTATQLAVIQNLSARRLDAEFIGISPEPEDTLRSLSIAAFSLSGLEASAGDIGVDFAGSAQSDEKWYAPIAAAGRISRFVRTLDILIISGGGQIDDFWGGPWGHPWSMLLWTALARWHKVPVVDLGIGLDHLNTALSKHFSIAALRLARQRFFRDAHTRERMTALGLKAPSSVCPDLVFSLKLSAPAKPQPVEAQKPWIALSPISSKTWSHTPTDTHTRYLTQLAETGAALAQQGYALRIVCSQPTMDTACAQTLAEQLAALGASQVMLCDTPQVSDFIETVRGASLVIASRLHAVILSLIAGSPVLALPHLKKVHTLMQEAGMAEASLPLQAFSTQALTEKALQLLERKDALRQHIQNTHQHWMSELDQVFDQVISQLPAQARLTAA